MRKPERGNAKPTIYHRRERRGIHKSTWVILFQLEVFQKMLLISVVVGCFFGWERGSYYSLKRKRQHVELNTFDLGILVFGAFYTKFRRASFQLAVVIQHRKWNYCKCWSVFLSDF